MLFSYRPGQRLYPNIHYEFSNTLIFFKYSGVGDGLHWRAAIHGVAKIRTRLSN